MNINYEELMNTIGIDYITYYHTKRKCFLVRDKLPANSRYFIEVPYREECQRLARKYFRAMMNDEERTLANSFNERHGFFDFMRETGLIYTYYEALEKATIKVFEWWESENDLNIDWENADFGN